MLAHRAKRVRALPAAGLLAVAVIATGCSPITPYRTSLGVPTIAPPTSIGAPIEGGEVGVGGWVAGHQLGPGDIWPELNDPGLYGAPYDMGGWARVGLFGALELGASAEYAPGDAMRASAAGVLPIPGDDSVWGGSLWANAGWMWGSFGLGGSLEGTWMSMPYARFEYIGPPQYLDHGVYIGDDAGELYQIYEAGRVHPIRIRASGAFQFRKKGWEVAAGFAAAPVFTNNGFSIDEPPIFKSGGVAVGPVLDFGYDFGVMRVGAQAWYMPGAYGPTNEFDTGLGGRVMAELRPTSFKKDAANDAAAEPVHHPAP